jgi:hypothetical protein
MMPEAVAPWPGVSMAPNGLVAFALSIVMVLVPMVDDTPSWSNANA